MGGIIIPFILMIPIVCGGGVGFGGGIAHFISIFIHFSFMLCNKRRRWEVRVIIQVELVCL